MGIIDNKNTQIRGIRPDHLVEIEGWRAVDVDKIGING